MLDYLVSQVVSVPDHILDTFNFSKSVGLDPASSLFPQKCKEYKAYLKKYLKFSNPKTFSKAVP